MEDNNTKVDRDIHEKLNMEDKNTKFDRDIHEKLDMEEKNTKVDREVEAEVLKLMIKRKEFQLPQEDSEATARAYDVLKVAEFSNCILALIGFSSSAISYDIEFSSSSLDKGIVWNLLLITTTASTLLLLISIVWRTNCILEWEKGRSLYSVYDTLLTSNKIKFLSIELCLNSVHPNWLFKNLSFSSYNSVYDVYIRYAYNDILTICTLVRFYHIIRLYSVFSKYRSERAYRICKNNGKFAGTIWATKCLMTEDPLKGVFSMIIMGILIGGFTIRIFERPLEPYSGFDFSYYGNSMWLSIITMTTVGYGDFYPCTLPGRIIDLILCILGSTFISMMVITVFNMIKLGDDEEKALSLYSRLDIREEMREKAGKLLFYGFNYRKIVRDPTKSPKAKQIELGKFQVSLREFQEAKMRKKIIYNYNSAEDNIERRINFISRLAKEYNENLQEIGKRLKVIT